MKINTQIFLKQELSLILVWCDLCFAGHAWGGSIILGTAGLLVESWLRSMPASWVPLLVGFLHAGLQSQRLHWEYSLPSVRPLSFGFVSFFWAALQGLWDLSSLTRNGTHDPSVEAQNSNHWTTMVFPPLSHFGDQTRKSKEVWTVLRIIDWLTFAVPLSGTSDSWNIPS